MADYQTSLKLALKAECAYYQMDTPIMSDSAYDALIRELKAYEDEHPDEKSAISPTTRVGGQPSSSFEKVTFAVKMLSLKNAFNRVPLISNDHSKES